MVEILGSFISEGLNQWWGFLFIILFLYFSYHSLFQTSSIPTYGPKYLPDFCRGVKALVHLSLDEDDFLAQTEKLGPVVRIPWPMNKYFIFEATLISKIYSTPEQQLAFEPIRSAIQCKVFGSDSRKVSNILREKIYPAHSRGLAKINCQKGIERFEVCLEDRIKRVKETIGEEESGEEMEIDLVNFVTEAVFEASAISLFGKNFFTSIGLSALEMRKIFKDFDSQFPLMVSGVIPVSLFWMIPSLSTSFYARRKLIQIFSEWIRSRSNGPFRDDLDESDVVFGIIQTGLQDLEISEIAKILFANFWALSSNSPSLASHLILYSIQSPTLPLLLSEILTTKSNERPPLLSSYLYETLRLSNSSFSIRIALSPFHLTSPTSLKSYFLPKNSTLICATRSTHLNPTIWGPTPLKFNGTRFLNSKLDPEANRKISKVLAFGGGVSKCEGSNLAKAHLSIFLSLILKNFEFNLGKIELEGGEIEFEGGKKGLMPKLEKGRPGLGVRGFIGDIRVGIEIRKS